MTACVVTINKATKRGVVDHIMIALAFSFVFICELVESVHMDNVKFRVDVEESFVGWPSDVTIPPLVNFIPPEYNLNPSDSAPPYYNDPIKLFPFLKKFKDNDVPLIRAELLQHLAVQHKDDDRENGSGSSSGSSSSGGCFSGGGAPEWEDWPEKNLVLSQEEEKLRISTYLAQQQQDSDGECDGDYEEEEGSVEDDNQAASSHHHDDDDDHEYDNQGTAPSPSWKILPFCYCFPAHDPSQRKWASRHVREWPNTSHALAQIPGLRTALFSRLGPNTVLAPHSGWSELSNLVLRLHFVMTMPDDEDNPAHERSASSSAAAAAALSSAAEVLPSLSGTGQDNDTSADSNVDGENEEEGVCGVIVDGEVKYHYKDKVICFDDSKVHSAFNRHPSGSRIVLIIDIERPALAPPGSASGTATYELTALIQAMSLATE